MDRKIESKNWLKINYSIVEKDEDDEDDDDNDYGNVHNSNGWQNNHLNKWSTVPNNLWLRQKDILVLHISNK